MDGDSAKKNWHALNLPRKDSTHSIAKSKYSKQTKINNLSELLTESNGVKSIQADENSAVLPWRLKPIFAYNTPEYNLTNFT